MYVQYLYLLPVLIPSHDSYLVVFWHTCDNVSMRPQLSLITVLITIFYIIAIQSSM